MRARADLRAWPTVAAGGGDFVSIADLGAIPGEDCSLALRAAVETGRPIYIPAGQNWQLSGETIDLARSPSRNIVIAGAGSIASVLQVSGPARAVFRYEVDAVPTDGPTSFDFRHFCINGGEHHTGLAVSGPEQSPYPVANLNIDGIFLGRLGTGIRLRHIANVFLSNVEAQRCQTGFDLFKCPDSDLVNVRAQNGRGIGFRLAGELEDHRSEGVRFANCSTNGQHVGFDIAGCAFVNLSNCDTSDARGGGVVLRGSQCVHLSNGEFSSFRGSPNAAISTDAACTLCQFTGLLFYCASTGLRLFGERHTVTGCQGIGNADFDILLGARSCVVSGNVLSSKARAASILELPGADGNNLTGNVMVRPISLNGGRSQANCNICES